KAPWHSMKVKQRLNAISKKLADSHATYNPSDESCRDVVRQLYSMMRETWERVVEEVLFADVIERFRPEVKTLQLRAACVAEEDRKRVFAGMKRCSTFSGHDRGSGAPPDLPRFDDIEADLNVLIGYFRVVDERRKTLERNGSEFQKRPAAAELLGVA